MQRAAEQMKESARTARPPERDPVEKWLPLVVGGGGILLLAAFLLLFT